MRVLAVPTLGDMIEGGKKLGKEDEVEEDAGVWEAEYGATE